MRELGVVADAKEADALFESMLRDQSMVTNVVAKGELDLKRLVKTLFDFSTQANEEHKASLAQVSALKDKAKKLQKALLKADEASMKSHKRRSNEAEEQRRQEEQRQAEQKAAKEAARAQAEAKKAEEKLAFERKVAAKRSLHAQ